MTVCIGVYYINGGSVIILCAQMWCKMIQKVSWCSNAHFSAGMPNKHPVKGMDYLSWTRIAALQTSVESVTIGAVHISILKERWGKKITLPTDFEQIFHEQIIDI